MICPQTDKRCHCDKLGKHICDPLPSNNPSPQAPEPSAQMVEIERLVDRFYYDATFFQASGSCAGNVDKARAALMAAIRAYGEGK